MRLDDVAQRTPSRQNPCPELKFRGCPSSGRAAECIACVEVERSQQFASHASLWIDIDSIIFHASLWADLILQPSAAAWGSCTDG